MFLTPSRFCDSIGGVRNRFVSKAGSEPHLMPWRSAADLLEEPVNDTYVVYDRAALDASIREEAHSIFDLRTHARNADLCRRYADGEDLGVLASEYDLKPATVRKIVGVR